MIPPTSPFVMQKAQLDAKIKSISQYWGVLWTPLLVLGFMSRTHHSVNHQAAMARLIFDVAVLLLTLAVWAGMLIRKNQLTQQLRAVEQHEMHWLSQQAPQQPFGTQPGQWPPPQGYYAPQPGMYPQPQGYAPQGAYPQQQVWPPQPAYSSALPAPAAIPFAISQVFPSEQGAQSAPPPAYPSMQPPDSGQPLHNG